MLRTITIATAATLMLAGATAQAQIGPVLSGGGDDRTITYYDGTRDGTATPGGNVVGGGIATVTGGGDNRVITYLQPVAPRTGLVATITGGGDNRVITYAPAGRAAGGGMLAGSREPGAGG